MIHCQNTDTGEKIKLHLGCGAIDLGPDWISIDAGDYEHVKKHDVERLAYDKGSVDLIYTSHLFEYFNKQDAVEVLSRWTYILKPGGELRIAVPDFEAITKLYLSGKFPIEDFIGPIMGHINVWAKDSGHSGHNTNFYHRMVYDERSLCKLLHRMGYTKIQRVYGPLIDGLDDQAMAHLPDRMYETGTLISLNLIATK